MIEANTLDRIAEATLTGGPSESTVQGLREAWSGLHFSYCMDDDISGPKPVREMPGIRLYLVDGREHCLRLTEDLAVATGVVVAEVEDDDD